jgi:hypothetical protein
MNKPKACSNPDCSASTGIHEGLTFGRGDLDEHGYWEIPCGRCARAWEAAHPEDAPCWPFDPTAPLPDWHDGKAERIGQGDK